MPRIYNPDGTFQEVEHINAYLLPAPDIFVKPRTIPLSAAVPKMFFGNQPNDGGNLLLTPEERDELLKKCPQAEKYVRQFLGAREFIHNEKRFCLWLVDCPPNELRKMKPIYERVQKVREVRLQSKRDATKKLAEVSHLFGFISQPTTNYILVPSVSSEKRKYIPIDFVSPEIICSNLNLMIPDAEIWHFGILTSKVHMIWTKTVCGRLESRMRYSAKIVYNNFPWVKMEFLDYANLILAAKDVLKIRKNYPEASLADLYDDVTMPKDLRRAHEKVDKIVMKIYHLDENLTDKEIAVELLMHYKFVADYLSANGLKQLGQNEDDEEE